jgi:hypothetical protein
VPGVALGGPRLAALDRQRGRGSAARLGAALAVAAGLLVVFGALFASADAAFAELAGRIIPDADAVGVVRWIFLFCAAAFGLLGAAFLVSAPPDLTGLERPATRRVRRLEWVLPLAALDLLFAAFVSVQLAVLFRGSAHVLRTAGLKPVTSKIYVYR